MVKTRVGKITCFCFNYNYKLKISIAIAIIQVQVLVLQLQFHLQLQRKDSQKLRPITYKASSFAYVNTVDLFCISISDLLKPHFSRCMVKYVIKFISFPAAFLF